MAESNLTTEGPAREIRNPIEEFEPRMKTSVVSLLSLRQRVPPLRWSGESDGPVGIRPPRCAAGIEVTRVETQRALRERRQGRRRIWTFLLSLPQRSLRFYPSGKWPKRSHHQHGEASSCPENLRAARRKKLLVVRMKTSEASLLSPRPGFVGRGLG